MGKLDSFDKKQTKLQGLWHQSGGYYHSSTFGLTNLHKFKGLVRIQMFKNKYYDKERNTPNFLFRISSVSYDEGQELEIEEKQELYSREQVEKIFEETFERTRHVCFAACNYGTTDPYDVISDDIGGLESVCNELGIEPKE